MHYSKISACLDTKYYPSWDYGCTDRFFISRYPARKTFEIKNSSTHRIITFWNFRFIFNIKKYGFESSSSSGIRPMRPYILIQICISSRGWIWILLLLSLETICHTKIQINSCNIHNLRYCRSEGVICLHNKKKNYKLLYLA